jgi:membrane protease subunit (stomatin/prohibitin family)
LEDRKAVIYENLRDLQFEYRVGKLSDADYQQTKLTLQKELAGVMAEIDRITQPGFANTVPKKIAPDKHKAASSSASVTTATSAASVPASSPINTCPHCGAKFPNPMKFCGECGKAMG